MHASYRMKAEDLNDDFLLALKTLFKNKMIEIAVCDFDDQPEFDETDYLMANPANRKHLLDAVENIRHGRSVEVDLDQLS